ncbi:hypothetical protein CBL_12837 [Carabus blaptoides fortunei]
MTKRKYLSDDDLRIILESDEFSRSDEDEESNTSENEEDDEVVGNIEEVIQDLQLEEEDEELDSQSPKVPEIVKWTAYESDSEEIKKFLGLLIWMGLARLGSIPSYWSTRDIYKNNVAVKIMSRNRFELLLSNIHFSNNEEIPQGDRLGKIQPLIDALQKKYQDIMITAEDFVIDETRIPWRGDEEENAGADGGCNADPPSTSRASNTNRKRKNKQKPIAILAYNRGKAGIDLSDQICSYTTTLRKGIKWYRKLGIEYFLECPPYLSYVTSTEIQRVAHIWVTERTVIKVVSPIYGRRGSQCVKN